MLKLNNGRLEIVSEKRLVHPTLPIDPSKTPVGVVFAESEDAAGCESEDMVPVELEGAVVTDSSGVLTSDWREAVLVKSEDNGIPELEGPVVWESEDDVLVKP